MAGESVRAPVLNDLMKWHLYIGYSWEDREVVIQLLALMQNNGLTCSLRSSLDAKEQAQADNIKQFILSSHKCLLYISPDYLRDRNSQLEFKKAEKKLQLLGKNSVFGIVKNNVKREQLLEYEQFQLIYLEDGQTVQDCLTKYLNWTAFLNDYELKPELSLVQKENIGVGVAYTYFFSFLQIVIPGIRDSIVKEIRHSSAAKEPNEKSFLVKKMLIIIPKTLLSPMKLTDDTNFSRTDLSIKQCYDRAGKERREYTIPVYKLTDKESGNVYYFVTDIPSCLYAIREAYESKLNIMSQDDVYEARNDFVLTLKALLNHPETPHNFKDQWELLLWPDGDDDNNRMKLSEFVYQQINSKGLAEKLADILKQPIPESSADRMPWSRQTSFKYAGGISAYPMYSERPRYALKSSHRGYCIIINNFKFEFPRLERRSGAAAEIDELVKLFEGLKFVVDVRRNLTTAQMMNCLTEYGNRDHSESDAFVCCLLSHGNKGRISATEGEISVVKLMELFYDRNCPGLKGKPKLFFIGACQGKGEDEQGERMQPTPAESNLPGANAGTNIGRRLLPEANAEFTSKPFPKDLATITETRGPHAQCEARADIVPKDLNTITERGGPHAHCETRTDIVPKDLNTITERGGPYAHCETRTDIVPKDLATITETRGPHAQCEARADIVPKDLDTITERGGPYAHCETRTDIVHLDTITERGGPYAQCEDRTDILRELVPSGSDFIVSYACLPETVAWHDSTEGGLYVKALSKHLKQDLEIDVALRNVNQEVRDLLNTYDREGELKQDPFHIIMPPQKFLFLGST